MRSKIQRRFVSNWAENVKFKNAKFATPQTIPELQELVAKSDRVRVLGSGHSFNDICDTDGTLISLAYLRNVIELDVDEMTITFEGGATYGDIARYLAPRGAAVQNLPSLTHVSVAGALSTGTHGSGWHFGNLLKQVVSIEYVKADGSLAEYKRGDPLFRDAVVGLGALGPISKLTLDIVPHFQVTNHAYADISLQQITDNFEDLTSCDSFSCFIDFRKEVSEKLTQRFFLEEGQEPPEFHHKCPFGHQVDTFWFSETGRSIPVTRTTHWHDALTFFMENLQEMNMPNLVLQSEMFLPRESIQDGMFQEVAKFAKKQCGEAIFGTEVRVIPSDDFAMSPFCGRDSVSMHLTYGTDVKVEEFLHEFENALAPFSPRPHWGKQFSDRFDIHGSFPIENWKRFDSIVKLHDPSTTKFVNTYLERCNLSYIN